MFLYLLFLLYMRKLSEINKTKHIPFNKMLKSIVSQSADRWQPRFFATTDVQRTRCILNSKFLPFHSIIYLSHSISISLYTRLALAVFFCISIPSALSFLSFFKTAFLLVLRWQWQDSCFFCRL